MNKSVFPQAGKAGTKQDESALAYSVEEVNGHW